MIKKTALLVVVCACAVSAQTNVVFSARTEWEQFRRVSVAGEDEQALFAKQERIAIRHGVYTRIECFDDWMNQYDGTLVTDVPAFDIPEPCEYDFTTPWNAIRSYRHGLANCDPEVILRHSDSSFVRHAGASVWRGESPRHRKRSSLRCIEYWAFGGAYESK